MSGSNEIIIGATNTQFIDGDRSARYPKREEYVDSGIMFLNGESISRGTINKEAVNFITEQKYRDIKKGRIARNDILLTTRGNSIGDAAFVTTSDRGLINAQMLILRADSRDIHPKFLFYYITSNSLRNYILNFASGSAQPQIPIRDFKKIPLYLPKILVQRKIAAILSTYDELIENNQRRVALLEKMAEEIYREWFVRMRFPDHEKMKKVKGVPEGWKIQKLGQLFNTSSGGTPPRENISNFNGEICWAKTGELKSTFVLDTEEKISQSGIDSSAAKIYPRYTIVIAMYCAMPDISILAVDSATNQACCAFFPKNDYFHYSYSYLLIKFAQKHMINFAHGAAQQNLSQELIKGFPLLTPTKDLIIEYSKVAESIFIQVEQLMKTNTYLRKIRDQLLPRLISGKLSVEHLDIQFPPGMEESVHDI
ncbi:restriction endonuclease subunit S [Nitrosomonas sp.]|uniref:restriction endonuclease subunit S n=1 Tax=Nitrosomonas sp. TaxID=42353 RepID=UPI0027301907|nr:restriction endonuclease subunit S [Nitrosomonas sp.]MDP2222827.1 restriction endonuclease subunit S [Nitrosomonas sp.]